VSAWILKTEPETYSFEDLVKDKQTLWDGVRNYTARNNLKAMKSGDVCFIYHSVDAKEIVGLAEVVREHYPDPTSTEPKKGWVCVDVAARAKLAKTVTLEAMKKHKVLKKMILVRQSRLSVCPVSAAEEKAIRALSA
jgi:predicted RNA-binding protein with PUA-like domain